MSRVGHVEACAETQVAGEVKQTLREFAHWVDRATSFVAKRLSLHVTDLSCIGLLYSNPDGVSPKEIMQYLGITSGAATALIDRLERIGYVHRAPNPHDRRGVVVQLVPGNPDAATAFFAREHVYSNVVEEFTEAELTTILRFMRHLIRLEPSALIEDQEERLYLAEAACQRTPPDEER